MREKDTIRGKLEQDPDLLEEIIQYAKDPDFAGMQTAEEWEARNAAKKESRPGKGREAEKDNHNNNFTANNKNKQGEKEKKPSKPPLTLEKFIEILAEKSISVRLNQITREAEISGISDEYDPENLQNDLPAILHDFLKLQYSMCSVSTVQNLLSIVSGLNRFNPVREMLDAVTWDGRDRLPELFAILYLEGDKLSQLLVHKWLMQSISLALYNDPREPFGADGILVLVGLQGIGKTSVVQRLGVKPGLYRLGQKIKTLDKDTTRRVVTTWICELGELESTLRSDLDELKALFTAEQDIYRLPYGRTDVKVVRRTSIVATCNSGRFLGDHTGNRRYWVVPVKDVSLDLLATLDSLQLWAQIRQEVDKLGPQCFRLTRDERAALDSRNAKFEKPLPAEDEVNDIITLSKVHKDWFKWIYATTSDFKNENESLKRYSTTKINAVLDKIGITEERKRIPGESNPRRLRKLPMRFSKEVEFP